MTVEGATDGTIAAIASAPGRSQRGIIRVSGENTLDVIEQLTRQNGFHPRNPQRYSRNVLLGDSELQLPVDVYLWPTNRSFTGEPLAEIHCVGSPPLLNEILEQVFALNVKPAQPGAFTLRAFLSGRIDLLQAEAVLGVIDAGNSNQLERALQQLAGGISTKIAELREELLIHLADLEAGLDFVEEDIEFVEREVFLNRIDHSIAFLNQLLTQSLDRMESVGLPRVVLAGLPNAGKSALFNALLKSERALVSKVAGTTRDYLSCELTSGRTSFTLIDTAGWEIGRNAIEQQAGSQRADQYRRANLVVWCEAVDLADQELETNSELLEEVNQSGVAVLRVKTKADLLPGDAVLAEAELVVSASKSLYLNELLQRISQQLSTSSDEVELLASTSARCRESLSRAVESLERTREMMASGAGDELISMELRESLDHLGRIVGVVYTDDILDRVFSRFCIGK
ncbi:tRNA modification GTPase MnmE [Thalassoglobus neptunius]|uniref:tRNA modification GTPase MnmE n=1 Tax=Thalassoglobus neptunius TaxID=1938619 RepID=A0A5C5X1H5_9PLAN|nr:tRNA modification GTPase [Thalassoglobus neptunius]TWT56984.1 tRNA modification GTPase MnmE [Thalassoglobus neptunius]